MPNRRLGAIWSTLLMIAGAGFAQQSPAKPAGAGSNDNLSIDFGPAQHSPSKIEYSVPWKQGMDPVQYLQAATKLQPPLTYRCVGQDPVKPCYVQHGDCTVTEIDGVKAGAYNGKQYGWIWEIDGNQGALPACIFSVNSARNRIGFKLLEVGQKKP
jgi:hypothetical protein